MKKINIGIILLILAFLAMTLFLIFEKFEQKKDIENIKSFLLQYYEVYNKYSTLYEEDRDINKIQDRAKYDEYKNKMKLELDKYLTTNEELKQKIYDNYTTRINDQIEGKYMYTTHIKTIENFNDKDSKVYFCNNYIFVMQKLKFEVCKTSRTATIYNKETKKYEGNTKNQDGTDYIYEYLILTKINGEIKIVTHSMVDPVLFSFDDEIKEFYI